MLAVSHRNGLCGHIKGGAGNLPLPRRLRAEFRHVAAVAATSPRTGTDPWRGVSCGDEGRVGLEAKSMAFHWLLEVLGGRSKV